MNARGLLKRLLTMDRDEVRFRATTLVRREVSRVTALTSRPRWRRAALIDALRDDLPSIQPVRASLAGRDWLGAHHLFMRHVTTHPARFVLDPAERGARVRTILDGFPGAGVDAVGRGNQIASHSFDLLGYRGLRFDDGHGTAVDWHVDPVHQCRAPRVFWSRVPYLEPGCGDHKIIWELNRHQYWMALGRSYWLTDDSRYRETFVDHLDSWMAANPPLFGMNWASMLELSLRSLSWLWALHFFSGDPGGFESDRSPWTVDLLLGLDAQMTLVSQNLSRYFSPNTHLLGEALALYVVGRALPELRRAEEWERLGREVLIEQIARQINADGGHAERSTHYHRYTLDFYLLALGVARRTDDPAASSFAGAVRALASFARAIADDSGRLPGIGDDDGGALFPICGRDPSDASDSLQLAAQLLNQSSLAVGPPAEEVVWMTGVAPSGPTAAERPTSVALLSTGYFVSRSGRGDHLTIDAGPHGFLNGGHAHSDALSMTLAVRGRPLLIDPGTGCYTIDAAVRDRFRSTRYHNTATIDGRSQSVPAGPFHWQSAAHATLLDWRTGSGFDLFEGAHDGYGPLVHHRSILARSGSWFIVDRLVEAGTHRADLHWHFHPSWEVAPIRPGTVCAGHPDGTKVWMLSLHDACDVVHGSAESDLGWCAPVYGTLVPTTTVRMSRRATAPFAFVTLLVESVDEPTVESLSISRTAAGEIGPDEAVGFSVQTRAWSETALFTRRAGQPKGTSIWSADGLETDARILCWRRAKGQEPRAEVLIDGSVQRRKSTGALRSAMVPQHYWIPS